MPEIDAADLTPEAIDGFADLQQAAEALSKQPYQAPPVAPEQLRSLDYDQFRHIQFRGSEAIWLNEDRPFLLGFYHKGFVQRNDVTVNVLQDGHERRLPFSPEYFHYYGETEDLEIPDDLGFAGFRVLGHFRPHAMSKAGFDEIFSFLGASYFRARTAGSAWGTSARGLAINAGLPKDEEFPAFREFWVTRPEPDDTSLTVLALLESPSVTGAYQLVLTPGVAETSIDIREHLYFRQTPEKVGIGPMSSMWMWGDGLSKPAEDDRPEVHDADGLQIQTADGRWIWRALGQQHYPSLVRLPYRDVTGFGLLQRDTDPEHYRDQEALYHKRPSVWIEPRSDWGSGSVELLELPAPHEGTDNIAAWWVPEKKIVPGEPVEFEYRVSYFLGDRRNHPSAKAIGHRIVRNPNGVMRVEIDFRGATLAQSTGSPLVEASTVRGQLLASQCSPPSDGNCTVKVEIQPTGEGPVELTVVLKDGASELTETWAALCPLTAPKVSLPPWRQRATKESKE